MIILASQSKARRALLARAGIPFRALTPPFDEDMAKAEFKTASGRELAASLALGKANAVSALQPDDLVIGADQTLSCDGVLYDKPGSRAAARDQLRALRGKTHVLSSAVCCVERGQCVWSLVEDARITFRQFSDGFIESYLDEAGQDILSSVGAYHYEGSGIRLMAKVEGSDHAILGLPVLPLASFLHAKGFIAP